MTNHCKPGLRFALLVLLACALASGDSIPEQAAYGQAIAELPDAQWLQRFPKKTYYQGLEIYRDGDLATATEAFQSALAACLKDQSGLWIDAIPVHALLGECYYHAGDLRQAMLHIEASLGLLSRHRNWIESFDWSRAGANHQGAPDARSGWATTDPPPVLALPDHLGILARDVILPRSAASGAIRAAAGQAQVDAVEVFRGAAIASYRRRLILGELADQSPRFAEQVRNLASDAKPQSTLPRTLWAAVEQCVRFSGGQPHQVEDFLSLCRIDQAIHPVTPVLLLAAARRAIEQERFVEAAPLALQAAEAASFLGQTEYVGEALILAIGCTDPATAAARREGAAAAAVSYLPRGRLATVGSLLAASEAALIADDAEAADKMLVQAKGLLQRRNLRQPRLAAHADYLAARIAARTGHAIGGSLPAVDEAITRLLSFAAGPLEGPSSPATPRRFQLNLALAKARQRGADPAQAGQLLGHVTANPPAWLWKADPVDALAYHGFDRSPAITAQLDLASKRDVATDLVVLSDTLLRHRFLAQLPLGGRVQQVRQMASVNRDSLVEPVAAMRAGALENMGRLTAFLTGPDAAEQQRAAYREQLESLVTEIALQRCGLPAAMPFPVVEKADVQRLGDDQAMLIFVDLGRQFLGVLQRADGIESWTIPSSRTLATEVARVLRGIGVPEGAAGSRIDDSQLWKQDAVKLRRRLIPDEHLAAVQNLNQLIVIPDGVLWYLPLELLPLSDAGEAKEQRSSGRSRTDDLLAERISVRYCPTPGLAFWPDTPPAAAGTIALVGKTLLSAGDESPATEHLAQLATAPRDTQRPDAATLRRGPPGGVLVVLADTSRPVMEPLEFSPLPGVAAEPLRHWLRLPLQVPRSVVMPGFRSAAEETPLGDGQELFLTLTALRCCGVREVLISRWAVGGESTTGLMSELLQELPFEGMQIGWRRSVQLLRRTALDPRSEPLLSGEDAQREQVNGDHPLFWAGYLLDAPPGP